MTPLNILQHLLESGSYDYASTQINLPAEMADMVTGWGQLNVTDDALFVDEDGGKGRELQAHITLKYGLLASEVPDALREIAQATAPFPVAIGKVSLFTSNPDFDVVKLTVRSTVLMRLNQRISAAIENEDTHAFYQPHITVAYVEKGTCDHLVGADVFADPEISREFIASGLVYSGPGAEDDPDRVKETLLFSRLTKPEPVGEAVCAPNRKDVDAVIELIAGCASKASGSTSMFVRLVNDALQNYGVRFYNHPKYSGAQAYADENGICLKVPSRFDLNAPGWLAGLRTLLYHEVVHGMQMDRMGDPAKVCAAATEYVMPDGEFNQDHYLKQKQEIMAYAATMVDQWHQQHLTSDEMMQRLRSGSWGHGQKYFMARRKYPETYKRFVKQATEYIQQVHEAAFEAISTTESDPFAGVNFPVDAGGTRRFLQARSRANAAKHLL